jgi:hypothetical protein
MLLVSRPVSAVKQLEHAKEALSVTAQRLGDGVCA